MKESQQFFYILWWLKYLGNLTMLSHGPKVIKVISWAFLFLWIIWASHCWQLILLWRWTWRNEDLWCDPLYNKLRELHNNRNDENWFFSAYLSIDAFKYDREVLLIVWRHFCVKLSDIKVKLTKYFRKLRV